MVWRFGLVDRWRACLVEDVKQCNNGALSLLEDRSMRIDARDGAHDLF